MKQCPFCKAQIEENARFCLYCMASLEEKQVVKASKPAQKGWLLLIVALLILALSVGLVWRFGKPPLSSPDSEGGSTTLEAATTTYITTENTPAFSSTDTTSSESSSSTASFLSPVTSTSTLLPAESSLTTLTTLPSSAGSSTVTTKPTTTKPTTTTKSKAPTSVTASYTPSSTTTSTTSATTTTAPVPPEGIYTFAYTELARSDRESLGVPKGSIKIYSLNDVNGEFVVPENGHYVIPETIDGKTVVMVEWRSANSWGETVTEITIPATVLYFSPGYYFEDCPNLGILCFRGKETSVLLDWLLDMEDHMENQGRFLTIHCAADSLLSETLRFYGINCEECNG